jgi:FdhD protein
MPESIQRFDVVRFDEASPSTETDQIAAEVPLEVRLHGQPFSVIMRTPGADADLAAGFLLSESVVSEPDDIQSIESAGEPNVVDVRLSPARAASLPDLLGGRRQVVMNSSCGMCGRRSLESLEIDRPALSATWSIARDTIRRLPSVLRGAQHDFGETGGLHAAGLFDRHGRLEASAEDVGRHNAVDKLVGRMLRAGRLPLSESLLFVSGRSSFEIVQKAFLGGIPFVAAASAPSSLAIELARSSGITLLGFVRDGRFNCYAGRERIG